jgi:hypothetical protein
MIPIRDTLPSKNFPIVNTILIGVNIVVFLIQGSQGEEINKFIYIYGLVPARYSIDSISSYFSIRQQLFSLISFMFLHGGFFHLLGNMWSLYIFGDNVEDRIGSLRYLIFYLLCGLASGLFHLFINLESNIPTIGASGAIAGVMGAYFITFPGSKVLTLIPILFIPYFIELPAFIFLGIWFLFQFLSAAGTGGNLGGIAWWAHIGGFVFGMIFLKLFSSVPSSGFTEKVRRVTERKKTHRLQMIHSLSDGGDLDLQGEIVIAPFEAFTGTHKLVNIPWGFTTRMFRVAVPPGTKQGNKLRLKGLGKRGKDGLRGDLYLTVSIKR